MPAAVRKPLILIVGSSVFCTGLALLVLPGPGWAAIFLGIAILASEFAAAEKVRLWMKEEVKIISRNMRAAGREFKRRFK